ncbi:MAG: serine/threonine protein kinase [Myxococcales bacterium]|nr:serine/threonine protein kinase [Myxococcales bacterium]
MDDPRIGTIVAERYQVLERLAQGGMGAVYRGTHIDLGREVAIKFLHEWAVSEPAFVKRFEVEARAMASLQHASCAQVLDVGVAGGAPFVVMEFVGGRTLHELLDDGPLEAQRAIEIARQVLAALDHAHGQGIIHRDIKPANVAVTSSEFGDQVKVLDFGLAKVLANASQLTGAFAVGTPSYMPPEQSLGLEVDARTDLYAVGVMLFELLTGDLPFVRDDPAEVIAAHRTSPPPLLCERNPAGVYSAELEAVLVRALAKAPADRYPSATEMARALAAVPEARVGRVVAMTPAPTPLVPRPLDSGTMVLGSEAMIAIEPAAVASVAAAPVVAVAAAPVVAVAAAPPAVEPLAVEPPVPVVAAPAVVPLALPPAAAMPMPVVAPMRAMTPTPTPLGRLRKLVGSLDRRGRVIAAAVVGGTVVVVIAALVGGGASSPKAKPPPSPPGASADPDPPTSAELEALRPRLRGADTSDEVVRALQRLGGREPTNGEIPLALGQVYCERLWVSDCLQAFRKAIQLAPALRDDPRLVGSAVYGLGNDRAHGDVRRFLVREVGASAVPTLTAVVEGRWRKEVKERATATLRDLGAAP